MVLVTMGCSFFDLFVSLGRGFRDCCRKGFCVHKNCLIPPLFTQPFFLVSTCLCIQLVYHIKDGSYEVMLSVYLRSRKRPEVMRLSLLQHDYRSNNDIVAR